jgi:general secretion pathway protein M
MTTDLPEGWRGRILALLLTIAVIATFWAGIVQPLIAWHGERADELDHQSVLARHMADIAATVPALRQNLDRRSGSLPASAAIDSQSDGLAGATLQGLVQDYVARAGARLNSAEILPAMQRGEWRRIGLRLSVTASLPALATLLQMIQHSSVTMLLDDVQLRAIPVRATSEAPIIDSAITVYGFRAEPSHARQQ